MLLKEFVLEDRTFSRNQYSIEIRRTDEGDTYHLIDGETIEISIEHAMSLLTGDTIIWCSDMEN